MAEAGSGRESLTLHRAAPMLPFAFSRVHRSAGVAQLVEHLICNEVVGGSSPFASLNVSRPRRASAFQFCGGVPERSKGTDCKSVGDAFGGSNPPPSTIQMFLYQEPGPPLGSLGSLVT